MAGTCTGTRRRESETMPFLIDTRLGVEASPWWNVAFRTGKPFGFTPEAREKIARILGDPCPSDVSTVLAITWRDLAYSVRISNRSAGRVYLEISLPPTRAVAFHRTLIPGLSGNL